MCRRRLRVRHRIIELMLYWRRSRRLRITLGLLSRGLVHGWWRRTTIRRSLIIAARTIVAKAVLIPRHRRWLIMLRLLLSVVHVCHCVVHDFAIRIESYTNTVHPGRMLRDGTTPVDHMARGRWSR